VRDGRGGHPAALDLGDRLVDAAARVAGSRLIYKGEDFAQTDIA
jgi:ribonuclease VapC